MSDLDLDFERVPAEWAEDLLAEWAAKLAEPVLYFVHFDLHCPTMGLFLAVERVAQQVLSRMFPMYHLECLWPCLYLYRYLYLCLYLVLDPPRSQLSLSIEFSVLLPLRHHKSLELFGCACSCMYLLVCIVLDERSDILLGANNCILGLGIR